MQIVVNDRGRDRSARDVNKISAGQAQHQHAEHALLIMMHARDLRQLLCAERTAGNNNVGLVSMRVREHPSKQRCKSLLNLCKAPLCCRAGYRRVSVENRCSAQASPAFSRNVYFGPRNDIGRLCLRACAPCDQLGLKEPLLPSCSIRQIFVLTVALSNACKCRMRRDGLCEAR